MATVQQLNAAFGELRNAEGRVHALYRHAFERFNTGRLTEDARMMVHAARDELFAVEMRAYTFLTTATGRIPGAETMAAAIPSPTRLPDLPPIPTGEGRAAYDAARAAYEAGWAARRGTQGLGNPAAAAAAPALALNPWVLAAGVIVAVVAIGAVAWVLVEYGDDIMAIMQFSIATSESGRRYDDCIKRGYTVEQCAAAHPGPTPAPGGLPWYFWAVLGAGLAVAAGIGVYGYVKRKQVGAAFGAYKAASLTGSKTKGSDPFKFAVPARGQGG